ncbi:MAG: hypothetical protein LBC02_13460, partial [Planctomycetaceae bacterium]|nr:hypothetical protein [Planctomycetaceae bacterium]
MNHLQFNKFAKFINVQFMKHNSFVILAMFIAILLGNIATHAEPLQKAEEEKEIVSSLFENDIRPLEPEEVKRKAEEEKRKMKEDYYKGIFVPKLTTMEAEAVAKTEVDLELYYKTVGFWFEHRNFSTLLNFGNYQLLMAVEDWQKKLRDADEFDKPAIQKQLVEIAAKVKAKQEEIKSKTFY